jgi:hypothetical protein
MSKPEDWFEGVAGAETKRADRPSGGNAALRSVAAKAQQGTVATAPAEREQTDEEAKQRRAAEADVAARAQAAKQQHDAPTYASVREEIERAEDHDVLDLAQSLVGGLPKQFHAELNELANAKRSKLGPRTGDLV